VTEVEKYMGKYYKERIGNILEGNSCGLVKGYSPSEVE
jgi:hypothetical protein